MTFFVILTIINPFLCSFVLYLVCFLQIFTVLRRKKSEENVSRVLDRGTRTYIVLGSWPLTPIVSGESLMTLEGGKLLVIHE